MTRSGERNPNRVRSAAVRWRQTVTRIGCAAIALALAGCATPGYSPGRIQSELVKAGATSKQAQCVTDGLSAKFDENQLGSHSEPHSDGKVDEFKETRLILQKCGLKLPLQPR